MPGDQGKASSLYTVLMAPSLNLTSQISASILRATWLSSTWLYSILFEALLNFLRTQF